MNRRASHPDASLASLLLHHICTRSIFLISSLSGLRYQSLINISVSVKHQAWMGTLFRARRLTSSTRVLVSFFPWTNVPPQLIQLLISPIHPLSYQRSIPLPQDIACYVHRTDEHMFHVNGYLLLSSGLCCVGYTFPCVVSSSMS